MDELESFYANLYEGSSHPLDSATPMFLDVSRGFPALTDDLRKICDGKIGYSECFNVLGTFPKNKTPGNAFCVFCRTISLPSLNGLRCKLAKIALFLYLT